jgi:hypothetical protein
VTFGSDSNSNNNMAAAASGMHNAGTTRDASLATVSVALCFATVFLGMCDRVQMSIAIIPLSAQLGWTLDDKAHVSAALVGMQLAA